MGGLNDLFSRLGRMSTSPATFFRSLLILLGCVTFAACATPREKAASVSPIEFQSAQVVLKGSLYKPAGKGPFPAIVVVHGASGGEREYPLYRHLVEVMNAVGVAVLAYDRRGSGESEDTLAQTDYDGLARDVVAAVEILRGRGDIDSRKIGLWGHSQGGWIAPTAYFQAPGKIAFMILVSGSGVTPAVQMEYAARIQVLAAGHGEAAAARAVEVRRLRDGFFRGTVSRDEAQSAINEVAGEPWFRSLFIRPQLPADPRNENWAREMDVAISGELCAVRIPVGLFYGQEDAWVPVEPSIAIWESCLRRLGTPFEVHRIPGAGHTMIVDEPADLNLTAPGLQFSRQYKDELVRFVRNQTGRK